jgi:mRNA interferase MazF
MPSYSKHDVILVRYPFSDLSSSKERGVYTVHESLVIKVLGQLSKVDAEQLEQSLRDWLGL